MGVEPMRSPAALLPVLIAVLTTGCASSGSVPRPFPMPGARPSPVTSDVDALIGTALDLRGVPYRDGGSDPQGFDCSGFTQYVFGQHGVALPRAVREQFREGQRVDVDDLEAGDLLFFSTTGPGVSHVAIAVGGDTFVHAPSSTGVVRVERLSSSYWSRRFVGARRLTN